MASKQSSNNKSDLCLNIEIKDFIEIGNEMNADDVLPLWAKYVFDFYTYNEAKRTCCFLRYIVVIGCI